MGVVMLLIAREDGEHLSVHNDDDAALEALVRYVDDHWSDTALPAEAASRDPVRRVDEWVKATKAFYLIGEPSIEVKEP